MQSDVGLPTGGSIAVEIGAFELLASSEQCTRFAGRYWPERVPYWSHSERMKTIVLVNGLEFFRSNALLAGAEARILIGRDGMRSGKRRRGYQ